MDTTDPHPRPHHRRNLSSKSGILRALVPSKTPMAPEQSAKSSPYHRSSPQKVPLAPPGTSEHARSSRPLGERQSNVQSPPSSPSKARTKSVAIPKSTTDTRQPGQSPSKLAKEPRAVPRKAKSSANLGSMFSKMNRSSKDLSQPREKDKENTTPPASSHGNAPTPIWAQFATTAKLEQQDDDSREDVAKFTTPSDSPKKLTLKKRPQSTVLNNVPGASDRSPREQSRGRGRSLDRSTSGSSSGQTSMKETLNIAKRGGRVLAAVAALQGKPKETPTKEEQPLDPRAVDEAFEAVLDSRNIPAPMREKMRSLTMRVKADFVKQNQAVTTPGTAVMDFASPSSAGTSRKASPEKEKEDDPTSTKRSRPRSRTFTFARGDKNGGDASPSKRQRSQSRGRPISIQSVKDSITTPSASPTKRGSSVPRNGHAPAIPGDFIAYLCKNQNPCDVEIGRIHKLRILLRNETVAWVDAFISLGGMNEVVGLLNRIMGLEWREEHEDQLLHETLLCLKGLCTTERAMVELETVADNLFPALLSMLYDDEKKGPAEYSTRTIIATVLFNFLQCATTSSSPEALEQRAKNILTYLSEPTPKPDTTQPLAFVQDMHVPRPYKLWTRELSNVTREVFWIFLHHLNVIPLPPQELFIPADRARVLKATYTHRHFPGIRPPVPAAPYIGGVEWDATTYLTAHLDLLNGLLASLTTRTARNALRSDLRASGLEKLLGATLRTCKEKFYSGVHDALRVWVAAAAEDGWETGFVREGPTLEEQAAGLGSPRKMSPEKQKEKAPRIEMPGFLGDEGGVKGDDGWLG